MEKVFIYALVDPRDNMLKYIGKTVNPKRRLHEHLTVSENTKKGKWVSKLLELGLQPVFEIIDEVSRAEEEFWEIHYISLYKSWGFDLKNHTIGGNNPPIVRKFGDQNSFKLPGVKEKILEMNKARKGKTYEEMYGENKAKELRNKTQLRTSGENNPMYGKTHSLDTKKKISQANSGENNGMFGKTLSSEHKEKLRKTHKGKVVSQETRDKLSAKAKNRIVSEETRKKLSAIGSGSGNPNFKGVVYQYSKQLELVKIWESLKEASETLGVDNSNIASCINKKLNTAYGFIWSRELLC